MKKKVQLSSYCLIVSALSLAVLCGVLVYVLKQSGSAIAVWLLVLVLSFLLLSTLFYMPLSVELTDSSLKIKKILKTRSIPLSEISEVRLCPPTMGAIRICGSGGLFGWYGWFREGDLGKYFAYYGKASDCFLVTLRDGRKYMLGCEDAPQMAEAIKKKL